MKRNKQKLQKSPEDLKFDNEFRKAKLQLEKGAVIKTDSQLPPEIESIFLDQIERFDKAFKKSKRTTVFEKLGKPKHKPLPGIPQRSIKKELLLLLKKMAKKGILVESICKVDGKEMYRFITEELFHHEIDSISIKGMVLHFIYEEFHPNHEYDVKRTTEGFIREVLSEKGKVENIFIDQEFKLSERKVVNAEKALEKINFIRGFYSKYELEEFEISGVKINAEKTAAEAIFDIKYIATLDGSAQKQIFAGMGKITLKNYDKWWVIHGFEMPGFESLGK